MVEFYIHRKSIIHSLPFFMKCIFLIVILACLYFLQSIKAIVFVGFFCILVYSLAKIPYKYMWQCIRLVLPFLLIVSLYYIFTKKYYQGIETSGRIIVSMLLANIISLTTSIKKIIRESEYIFFFLRIIKISPKIPGVLISIVLRTLPLLYLEKNEIEIASRLRGAKKKKKMNYKFIFSLLLRAVIQTDDVALALHMRGFSAILK